MNSWWYFVLFLIVPILVHLFDFRKAKKVYFSSVKYIINLTSKTKSKSKIKYYLVFANRLLIFLTIIALLWILIYKSSDRQISGSVTAYYDNSVSSSLGNADLKVEAVLKQIGLQVDDILFFDNLRKERLDRNSIVSISAEKSQVGQSINSVFQTFQKEKSIANYLFSDFQSFDVNELLLLTNDSTSKYQIFITNDINSQRNVSVDSLYIIPNQENLSELSVYVEFDVVNLSTGSVVVKMAQGDRQLSSIVKDVSELDFVRFDIARENFGEFEVLISGDDVSFDNEFHFVVGEKKRSRISILDFSESEIVKKVFKNNELFDVSVQSPTDLDFEVLQRSELIIISGLHKIPEVLSAQFSTQNFIILPSDSIDIESYQELINVNLKQTSEELVEINVDSNHPIWKGVFEKKINESANSSFIELFAINGNYESVISFRNGNPFLLKKDNIYFFNTHLSENSGGFHSNALFLPILYQIAFESSGGLETPYYYPRDKAFIQADLSEAPVKLVGSGYEVIPPFHLNGTRLVWEVPAEITPGKYFLLQSGDTLQQIAINTSKEESSMQAPSEEELREAFSNFRNVKIFEINSAEDGVFAGDVKVAIWKYALILILFLVLTETVLHRYFR